MAEEIKKRRGGRKRTGRKVSPTNKFHIVNREWFGDKPTRDWRKVKMVR